MFLSIWLDELHALFSIGGPIYFGKNAFKINHKGSQSIIFVFKKQ
jgi:hypothetical protein